MRHVDVGVFAHNEQGTIAALINDLDQQIACKDSGIKLRLRLLCNGCSDRTVEVAQSAVETSDHLRSITIINDFNEGGKALTWNKFVENLSGDSNFVFFIDGDIRIRDRNAISNLMNELEQSKASAVTSRPTKDLRKIRRNPFLMFTARLIGRKHRDGSIAGSFYAVKTDMIRQIRLPVPCLVEDGFLAACLVTGLFSHQGQPEKVKASSRVIHFFETPSSLREFFKHDVRLALGCELNAALYSDLWAARSLQDRIEILHKFSKSSGIDRSIDEHQKHPERSALAGTIRLCDLWGSDNETALMKILLFPFRFGHSLYMATVRYSARELFSKRRFDW